MNLSLGNHSSSRRKQPSLKAKANFPPMKNFADIEDMLILARPPQSELISCIGEPELGVRALEPRGLIEETEITETKIDSSSSSEIGKLENKIPQSSNVVCCEANFCDTDVTLLTYCSRTDPDDG